MQLTVAGGLLKSSSPSPPPCLAANFSLTIFTGLQAQATNSFPKILALPLFEVGVNLRKLTFYPNTIRYLFQCHHLRYDAHFDSAAPSA